MSTLTVSIIDEELYIACIEKVCSYKHTARVFGVFVSCVHPCVFLCMDLSFCVCAYLYLLCSMHPYVCVGTHTRADSWQISLASKSVAQQEDYHIQANFLIQFVAG
jgi:hypothetical protein